jgi:hypothetical protein
LPHKVTLPRNLPYPTSSEKETWGMLQAYEYGEGRMAALACYLFSNPTPASVPDEVWDHWKECTSRKLSTIRLMREQHGTLQPPWGATRDKALAIGLWADELVEDIYQILQGVPIADIVGSDYLRGVKALTHSYRPSTPPQGSGVGMLSMTAGRVGMLRDPTTSKLPLTLFEKTYPPWERKSAARPGMVRMLKVPTVKQPAPDKSGSTSKVRTPFRGPTSTRARHSKARAWPLLRTRTRSGLQWHTTGCMSRGPASPD